MVTLLNKINQIKSNDKEELRSKLTIDEFVFTIREYQMENSVNYDALSSIFDLVTESMSNGKYNVFTERLMLKLSYLHLCYNIPIEIVSAFVFMAPVITLDMLLEKEFLSEDEFFHYIEKAYKDYKQEINFNVRTFLNVFEDMNLELLTKQLEENMGKLETISKS